MANPEVNFQALERAEWSDTERSNARTMSEFVQLLMNDHDFAQVRERFSTGTYIQHNRAIPDGIDGLTDYVAGLAKRFPDYSYDVRRIVASGELVVFHSHATLKATHRGNQKKGFIIFDTWKLENGEIVDHWDALQPLDVFARLVTLLGGGRIRNDNGIY